MFRKLIALTMALAFVLLPGCATLQGGGPDQTALDYFQRYQHIMRLGVQVAVFSLLEPNPTYAPRIAALTEHIQNYLESDGLVDLRGLEEAVRARIDWSGFSPTEKALAEALIVQVRVEIENVLEANKTALPTPTEEFKMIASSVIGWLDEAANVFIAQQGDRAIVPVFPPYDG